MEGNFLRNTTLIEYSSDFYSRRPIEKVEDISFSVDKNQVRWFNTYGILTREEFAEVVTQNKLNDFLLRLFADMNHPNKVMDLGDVVFMTIQVLKPEHNSLGVEQMVFILTKNVIWSIQEKKGDYFEWIRDRLANKIGLIRDKNADYLMYFILDSVLENYSKTVTKISEPKIDTSDFDAIETNPDLMQEIEKRKKDLFLVKKTTTSVRDGISKLEVTNLQDKKSLYFNELKEQTSHLLNDLDFELNLLESATNLLFTIQGNRLNEVMKLLTLFSVVFIPLTFLAGIYGMNFEHMPELQYEHSYFILLGVMALVTIGTLTYFYRKRWM